MSGIRHRLFLGRGGRACRRRRGAGLRRDDTGSERKVFHRGYAGYVVSRLTEAGGRQADLFFIVKGDALAHNLVQLAGERVIPDSEVELLRRGARHRNHRQFAFPGFAQPAFLRKLLHLAGALTGGVVPAERRPEVADDKHHHDSENSDENSDDAHPTPCYQPLPCGRIRQKKFFGVYWILGEENKFVAVGRRTTVFVTRDRVGEKTCS
jgi:hypothetical protein